MFHVSAQSFTQTFGGAGAQDGVGAWPVNNGYRVAVRTHEGADQRFYGVLHSTTGSGSLAGSNTWPFPGNTFLQNAAPAPDGSSFVLGSALQAGIGKHDAFFSKVGSDGAIAWTQSPSQPGSQQLFGGVALSDGGAVFCGLIDTASFHQPFAIRCDASGNILWSYTEPTPIHAEAYAVAADGGHLLFTGRTSTFSGHDDMLLFKTDMNGNSIWSSSFGGSATDVGRSISPLGSGNYVVAGWSDSFGPMDQSSSRRVSRAYLVAFDMNGDTLWTRTVGDTTYDQHVHAMDRLPSGELVLAGERRTLTGSDAVVLKITAIGDVLWERVFDLGREDRLTHVTALSDGLIATGWSFGEFGRQVLLIRRNPDGN